MKPFLAIVITVLTVMLIVMLASSCHPPQQKLMDFAEGASMAHPVVVKESIQNKAIAAEYQWLRDHYKFYNVVAQRVVSAPHGGDNYDVITIEHVDGAKQDVYFRLSKSYIESLRF